MLLIDSEVIILPSGVVGMVSDVVKMWKNSKV
jgi:hypothetical protein